jgi:hypothetical protein
MAVIAALAGITVFCVPVANSDIETGEWVVDTTPHYKGHAPGYERANPVAVCVNTRTDQEKLVPLTDIEAFGDASDQGWIKKGDPCPERDR